MSSCKVTIEFDVKSGEHSTESLQDSVRDTLVGAIKRSVEDIFEFNKFYREIGNSYDTIEILPCDFTVKIEK